MILYEEECKAAGLDPKEIDKIAKGLSKYGKMASELGITIFGGSTCGTLRIHDTKSLEGNALILARLEGRFDGGDGGYSSREDGLNRGE